MEIRSDLTSDSEAKKKFVHSCIQLGMFDLDLLRTLHFDSYRLPVIK